ncbi:hypothetical protein B4589_009480 [Halolamina sp. CBA1230]|uniref:hypothetical protein n=1 Tax=Halolamina sp. CBA1230 TaxID=1853690 RepID=UPI0009A19951|nr:hypothetical protein [Halolamina sp. CBA1230]QKY20596.1 hypothetical protein B4589_009480 [Halolamina sp. CBA1230]
MPSDDDTVAVERGTCPSCQSDRTQMAYVNHTITAFKCLNCGFDDEQTATLRTKGMRGANV